MEQKQTLHRAVAKEVIQEVLFIMNDSKAPGPDCFIQYCWSIVGKDFSEFILCPRLLHMLCTKGMNSTFVCLKAIVPDPSKTEKFRHISCCKL